MRRIGIDLALGGTHTAVLTEGSHTLGKAFRVATTRESFAELLERATAGVEGPIEFVLEPTGNVWPVFAAAMMAQGHRVVMVKTQKSSDLRKFLRRHTKTDAVDAATLARLPEVDPEGAHAVQLPAPEIFDLRRLVKQRYTFVRQATARKLRLHALLQLANPHLMNALGEDKFCPAARVIMSSMLNPLVVVAGGRAAFSRRLRKVRGIKSDRIEKIWQACVTTAELHQPLVQAKQLPFRYEQIETEARRELAALQFAEQQEAELDREIETLYRRVDPDQTLRQITGLGPVLAATVEAFSNPILRFPEIGKYAAYTGTIPRRKQTGKSDVDGLPMTKAGPRLLKRALRLAADTARQFDPEFAAIYVRHDAQGWHHEKILGLLAHKLARRVYALLRRREAAKQAGEPTPVHYELRSPAGGSLQRAEARSYVREHYPSKRRRAAATAAARTKTGSPSEDDATRRVTPSAATAPTPSASTPTATTPALAAAAPSAASSVETLCTPCGSLPGDQLIFPLDSA